MQSNNIRKLFTEFFTSKGHQKVPSSALIPDNDPSLLFANAGMNQFKEYFTGETLAPFPRATTIQKCVRAGGKHNDLENVGFTARHHTFFEMLGNFSFGDYFKEEAITMAWKLLTQELNISPDKLYVTVHHSDQEAFDLWKKKIGVPEQKIFKLGDKDNFWQMGDLGPCGPCTEIFYDHGEKFSTLKQKPDCLLEDEGRYVEIWNLVFMQFEETAKGRINLPKPSVDTGAGLERLSAVLQGKYWNYDTDLFTPLISQLETLSQQSYQKQPGSMRVIADHIRSATMLITDGVIPSNEGRGYVLRRIIRRAVRHLHNLGIKDPALHQLVPQVFQVLGKEYPQNQASSATAEKLLNNEEVKFKETLAQGLKYLDTALDNKQWLQNKTLSGEALFKLYDTYGFPPDLTETILQEKGLKADMPGFEKSMQFQKTISKKSWKGHKAGSENLLANLPQNLPATSFKGYETEKLEAKVLAHLEHDAGSILIVNQTPFYAEGGGQVGEKGWLVKNEKKIAITDTQSTSQGLYLHYTTESLSSLNLGDQVTLQVDLHKRKLSARNHSATHLLQAALRKVLGDHIQQAGSLVSDEKLRFDFSHPQALSAEEKKQVETLINQQIQADLPVQPELMQKEEALAKGAIAFFGEKYGEQVRVVAMGENQNSFSVELCGGIHVAQTADIGVFTLLTETALSSGVRRIEALTSEKAIQHLNWRSDLLSQVEKNLQGKDFQALKRLEQLQQEFKELQKEKQKLEEKLMSLQGREALAGGEKLSNGLIFKALEVEPDQDLKKYSDQFIAQQPNGVILLYSQKPDQLRALLRINKSYQDYDCSVILKKALTILDGKGGGRNDMAQGSGKPAGDLSGFINQVKQSFI